jgi:carboxyl-terminal processing protease
MKKYYVEPLDDKLLLEGAARGIVASVEDPYSHYMDKEEYSEMMEETSSKYAGIGIVVSVDPKDNLITVVSPFEDSPGEKAGVLPGDKIVKVDNKEVWGDKLNDAVKMMKGTPGTEVTISIVRDKSATPIDITVKRDIIKLETVKHKMLNDNIGYIRITGFYQDTASDFNKALDDLYNKKMSGLVIDLRNNPGGLLDQVVDIADRLVPKGLVVYTEDREKRRNEYTSDTDEIKIPLAILINEGSASASEILSGAVKDHEKGVLVGTKTFGKGVVQTVIPLFDGSGISVTTSKYYTPDGISIHGIGIKPDVEIDLPPELKRSVSQISEEDDVQLKKAVEAIK